MDGLAIRPPQIGTNFSNEGSVGNQAGEQNIGGSFFAGPVTNYHGVLTKEESAEDPGQLSLRVLKKLRIDRLQALDFDRQSSRYDAVKTAYPQTCEWALHRPEFSQWMDDELFDVHNGFFWIKGKPGTGKSTLMKFIIDKLKTANPSITTASFFFNARGEDIEKSTVGMYRSLLRQIFNSIEDLQPLLDSVDPKIDYNLIRSWDQARLRQYLESSASSFVWNMTQLQNLFSKVIDGLAAAKRQLICFVDALDECEEEEVRDMVEVFEELGRISSVSDPPHLFRTCFSSRHYPHITIETMVSFTLEDQSGHLVDIRSYIDNKLRIGKTARADTIKRDILSRSSGIFLWVVLVVQLLKRDYDHGMVHKLQQRLDQIPSGLQALFDDILIRDGDLEPETVLCLQFVMFARRPLGPEELYFGIRAGMENDLDMEAYRDTTEVTDADIVRYILSISKGLVEMVSFGEFNGHKSPLSPATNWDQSETPQEDQAPKPLLLTGVYQTVQLIHESVRQFLTGQWNLRSQYFGAADRINSSSHDRLKYCCRKYFERSLQLCFASIKKPDDLPLLNYATQNTLWHDELGGKQTSQDDFRTSFQNAILKILRGVVSNDSRIIIGPDDLSFIMNGLEFRDPADEAYPSELYLALELKAAWAFKVWFQKLVPDLASDDVVAEIVRIFNGQAKPGSTHHDIFLHSTQLGVLSIVDFYIENLGIDVNRASVDDYRALCLAAYQGHTQLVQLLIQHGADPNLSGAKFVKSKGSALPRYTNSLQAAALGGSSEVVDLLLKSGPAELSSPENLSAALMRAAWFGHVEVVESLLQANANVNAFIDDPHRPASSAIQAAVMSSHHVVVEKLLNTGADVNIPDTLRGSPLSLATKLQDVQMVKLLLDAGADTNVEAVPYGSCLNIAVSCGDMELVRLLLDHDANPNIHWEQWGGALYIASRRGDEDLCLKLLQSGADVNQQGGHFGNCLQAAAHKGEVNVVKILLGAGAVVNQLGGYFGSCLQAAVMTNDTGLVNTLIEAGADINLSGGHHGNCLHAAAAHGYVDIVNILLDAGTDVNQKGGVYGNALQAAVVAKNAGLVSILLEAGADVDAIGGLYKTAIQAAKDLPDVEEILLRAGARPITGDKDDIKLGADLDI